MIAAKSEQPIKFFWPDDHLDDFGVDDIHVGGEEVFFRNGKPFAGSWPGTLRVTLWGDPPDPLPHLLAGDGAVPVASREFLDVLRSFGVQNFETFPVELVGLGSKTPEVDYFAWNVLGSLVAADLTRSKGDTIMGGSLDEDGAGVPPLIAFDELVLKKSVVTGHHLFRLAESHALLLSQELLAELRKVKPTGGAWGISVREVLAV